MYIPGIINAERNNVITETWNRTMPFRKAAMFGFMFAVEL